MLCLDEIRDPERLRQVAVLLERENATLHAKIQSLIADLARLRGEAAGTAQRELAFLKELLAQRERALSTVAHREPLGVAHMEPVWRRDRIPDMTVVALPPTQRWCRASGAR